VFDQKRNEKKVMMRKTFLSRSSVSIDVGYE
jgi:hypothetical protein